jgi:hypothetical protein
MALSPERDPIEAAGRRFLNSNFLAERAARVLNLANWVAGFAELGAVACNRRAIAAGAWFQDAWCCPEIQSQRFAAPLVLTVQPTELQRRDAADTAAAQLSDIIDAATLTTALRVIRESGTRETVLAEAMVLGEATNLDSIGTLWLCGQFARCGAEDQPVAAAVALWERQLDYRYWARRIDETLRFPRSRELARHRCSALDACMTALRDQLTCGDRHVAP